MTLVERLRFASEECGVDGITAPLLREAANRIEELERSSLAYAERRTSDAARIAALEKALRDVLAVVWSGSSADRKFWRDEAVATFERAAALAQAATASQGHPRGE